MNTPPKRKRHTPPPKRNISKDDIYVGVISDPDFNMIFSDIITGFVYLEDRMRSVLAVLLGADDDVAAGYVLRAIKSPKGRIDVMKDLLELAPINKDLGEEYDAIIAEFRSINTQRNLYAHGYWWTGPKGEILLDEAEDPKDALCETRVVTIEEMAALDTRMLHLHGAIGRGPEAELKRRREERLRQRDAPKTSKRAPRRTAPK